MIFVNNILFLTSLLEHIYYSTTNTVANLEAEMLEAGLKNVVRLYSMREFNVVVILVDKKFKTLK